MEPSGAIILAGPLHAETAVLRQESVRLQIRTDVPRGRPVLEEMELVPRLRRNEPCYTGTEYSWHLVSREVRQAVSYLEVHGTPRPSKKKKKRLSYVPVVLRSTEMK